MYEGHERTSMNPAELAALCDAAMPEEQLTEAELRHVCFGEGDEVLGDDDGAVAFTIKEHGEHVSAWILLVAVRPEFQGHGRGRQLLDEALERARARGATRVNLANAIPRYLWPGVDLMNTAAGALVESAGFERDLVGINMTIPSTFRSRTPAGRRRRARDRRRRGRVRGPGLSLLDPRTRSRGRARRCVCRPYR